MRALSTIILFMLAAGSAALADTYTVNPEGSGPYPTIQAAVDAASDTDIVELEDGTYTGDGNRDVDFLGKEITVRSQSEDATQVTIDCQGAEGDPHRGFIFQSGETGMSMLNHITIRNGHAFDSGGVLCTNGSYPVIQFCRFVNNTGVNGGAIQCGGYTTIYNCYFSRNDANNGGAIQVLGGDALPEISHSLFVTNSALSGGAICCAGSSEADIRYCVFQDNRGSNGGAFYGYAGEPMLTNCTFVDNDSGTGSILGGAGSNLTIEACLIFGDTQGAGISLNGGIATITETNIYNNFAGDWVGDIAPQCGTNANFSADPGFCDYAFSNFELCSDSWCLSGGLPNGQPHGLVGALNMGCDVCGPHVQVEQVSWGTLKADYR